MGVHVQLRLLTNPPLIRHSANPFQICPPPQPLTHSLCLAGKDGSKITTVVATPGQGPDRAQEVAYTDAKVIGNGSFGVVYQAKLCETGELVAIKKVLQDKRFKVIFFHSSQQFPANHYPFLLCFAEPRAADYAASRTL